MTRVAPSVAAVRRERSPLLVRVAVRCGALALLFSTALALPSAADNPVWIGHVNNATGLPGTPGGHGPFGVGRGPAVPGADENGMWTWKQFQYPDSLQGWWPIAMPYDETAGFTLTDSQRAWWALDYGNQASYLPPQGPKRTFGVVGVWHRDNGMLSGFGAGTPNWLPLGGSYSAWMGLRAHGDLAFVDPITGNPFNEDALVLNNARTGGATGTLRRFPGYGSQMDQLLYRDIDATGLGSNSLTVSFKYRTAMSTVFDTVAATRTGWFQHDPLNVAAGNFISSSAAGANAPRDSFMVYLGAPVNDVAGWLGSDGLTRSVRDPARRYFGETVRSVQGFYREIFARASSDSGSVSIVVPNSVLAPLLSAGGSKLRLVYRVKTNRGSDDQAGGFVSQGRGAAQVDDITVTGGPVSLTGSWGNFESSSSIDNSTSTNPLDAWKSTGKPPQPYAHVHSVDDLIMEAPDPADCRQANQVISFGNHDFSEYIPGGTDIGPAGKECKQALVSPTICLKSGGVGVFNGQGIDAAIADATDDYYLRFDVYTGALDLPNTGITVLIGLQCYPVLSANGLPTWSDIRMLSRSLTGPPKECRTVLEGLRGDGLIQTSNGNGIPDSVRVLLAVQSLDFSVALPFGSTDGIYFDNVSFGLRDTYAAKIEMLQLDLFGGQLPSVTNTDWGAFDFTIPPGPDTTKYFFNLNIRRNNSTDPIWVVRNIPMMAQSDLEDSSDVRIMFDLSGIRTAPGPIDSVQYAMTLSSYPYPVAPLCYTYKTMPLLDGTWDAQGSVSSPPPSAAPGSPPFPNGKGARNPPAVEEPPVHDVPVMEEGINECGPVAVTRSLRWLHNKGKIDLGSKTDAQLIAELKAASCWSCAGGGVPTPKHLLQAKLKVTKNLDMVNKYARRAGVNDSLNNGNYTYKDASGNEIGTAINKGSPTLDFIMKELKDGEDVELWATIYDAEHNAYFGHIMTVVDAKRDANNGIGTIWLQDDPVQGHPGDKNKRTPTIYTDPDGNTPAKLPGINGYVEIVISESPRKKPTRNGNQVAWGGDTSDPKPIHWAHKADGTTGTIYWTCGRGFAGYGIPHPGYAFYHWSQASEPTGEKYFYRPNDPSITDWELVINTPNGKHHQYTGDIKHNSPWAFHSLSEAPLIDWRMPALAPIGPDSNVVVHMAVDYETYLLRNRFGFLGGGWSEGQTLASLGLNVVHGRIAGMEGVYLATTPFLFDPDSPTGWVPEDTTSWINSSTYPYPIQILGGLDAGNPTVSVEQQPLPRRLAFANHPNPFSGGTEFLFELPQPTNVRLAVYDASGRLVRSLMNAPYPAGRFSIGWNGLDSHGTRARPGVYFGKLETSAETATRRIVLLEAGSGR